MDQTIHIMNQRDKKVKENELYVKKIFLGKIRGEWSFDIFLLNLCTISVLPAIVFSLYDFRFLSLKGLLHYIAPFR